MDERNATHSTASLYRPKTKTGDPRVWFTKLPAYADPDDMMAITAHEGRLVVINLTKVDIDHVLDVQRSGALWELLSEIDSEATEVAEELLEKLRAIARAGLVPSVMDARADTAIGRTLETALGIAINSAKEPDYKGIELKSYRRARGSRENRKTLFAQVPNWNISKFKSSREILDNFLATGGSEITSSTVRSAPGRPTRRVYLSPLMTRQDSSTRCPISARSGRSPLGT